MVMLPVKPGRDIMAAPMIASAGSGELSPRLRIDSLGSS